MAVKRGQGDFLPKGCPGNVVAVCALSNKATVDVHLCGIDVTQLEQQAADAVQRQNKIGR
jgi:hypothetical protein